jgi:hypothetical protein
MQVNRSATRLFVGVVLVAVSVTGELCFAAQESREAPKANHQSSPAAARSRGQEQKISATAEAASSESENAALRKQLAGQQAQIEALVRTVAQLQQALAEQKQTLEHALQAEHVLSFQNPSLGQVASLSPALPSTAKSFDGGPAPALSPALGSAPAIQEQVEGFTKKVDQLEKTVGSLSKGLAGFKLSGDFRLRSDNIFRSSNSVAGPQQNVRARYRLRFNVDKAVSDQIDTHLQLSSGPFNNGLTYDSDYNGTVTRGSILLSEAWGDFHPNKNLSFRGGKMSEVFADNARFLMDDDVRLNGFQEIAKSQTTSSSLGKVTVEFRAGQYIFTNPNVQVLASNSAYATDAGYTPGRKVPSTNMFDQGIVVSASPSDRWSHQFTVNFEFWRNPNSIQLASLASGYALLGNPYNGVTLSGAISGTGNGTTTKGGGIFTADSFRVGQAVYRLDYKGWKTHRQGFPVSLEFHAAKNFGADFYGNALMGQISAGETKKFGDVACKYGFFYKQANSMISQMTDDDVGTGTGVNLRTHMIRLDLGLNKYMAWQNLLFIQNELAGDDPARNFYVNLQRGTGTQYRYQSQLQFTF